MKQRELKFKKTIFPNGLTLVTERNPGFQGLAIGVWVKVGTRHERAREAGVSHFLEHMLFKGTEKRSALEISKEIDQVGGEFNAFTSRDTTCFHINLLYRDIGLAIDILSDVLLNSTFDSEELERERKVILQEIAMVEDSPEEYAGDLFFEKTYGRNPLGRTILGSQNSIRKLSRGDILRFFRKHYRPENVVISVAGDVTHQLVKSKLGALKKTNWPGREAQTRKRKPNTVEHLSVGPFPRMKQGHWWIVRNTEQVHVIWGVPGFTYRSKDRIAAFLLNTYLGGGMSSALFQEIREKNGLAYTVYSSFSPFVDTGIFNIYFATGMNNVNQCLKLMNEVLLKIQTELLPEEELNRVKQNLKGGILLSGDSVEARMSNIANNEMFLGGHYPTEDVCAAIDHLTPHDIRRVARKFFAKKHPTIMALGPRPSKTVKAKLKPKLIK